MKTLTLIVIDCAVISNVVINSVAINKAITF